MSACKGLAIVRSRLSQGTVGRLSWERLVEKPLVSGDLDNHITGICDGLMAANPLVKTHPRWQEPDVADICPDRIVGLVDDSQVVQIRARRVVDASSPWYRLILEGETI